jgi:hypothetical protein
MFLKYYQNKLFEFKILILMFPNNFNQYFFFIPILANIVAIYISLQNKLVIIKLSF